jgi:hypothetical protein
LAPPALTAIETEEAEFDDASDALAEEELTSEVAPAER